MGLQPVAEEIPDLTQAKNIIAPEYQLDAESRQSILDSSFDEAHFIGQLSQLDMILGDGNLPLYE